MNINEYIEKLKTKPYEHQLQGLMYGLSHNKFLLGDSPGLGKTKQVIDIACYRKQKNNYKHCLIISPNSLKWNWYAEVHTHSREGAYILGMRNTKNGWRVKSNQDKLEDLKDIDLLPYFIITNIESLRYAVKTGNKIKRRGKLIDEVVYPITDKLCNLIDNDMIQMIACDECQMCKNPDSIQGAQLLRLSTTTQIAMSGTPLMNSPLDLYVPLAWLGYEDHSFWQYKVHYCRLGGYGGKEVIGYKYLDQLQSTLDRMMLRRRKEEVLDLPEKIYVNEYVEMSPKQQKLYDEIRNDILENVDKVVCSVNPLSELIRLRQVTGYPGILSSTVTDSAKLDRLVELVQDNIECNQKVIIFSNWKSMIDEVLVRLKDYSPLCITGDTNSDDRLSIVNKFQTDDRYMVICGTTGAMGVGLTITAANEVIFLDEPWTRAIRDQAEDRAHRIGTKDSVNIRFLLTKDSIDERIHSIVEEKGELSDQIIDGKVSKDVINYLLS